MTTPSLWLLSEKQIVSLEDASLRFAEQVRKYKQISCTQRRSQVEQRFITHLTELSRGYLGRYYHDPILSGLESDGEVARKGYGEDAALGHRLALVVNAFDMTCQKKRPQLEVERKNMWQRLFGPVKKTDGLTRRITHETMDLFDAGDDPFIDVIGNQDAKLLSGTLDLFYASLPEECAKASMPIPVYVMTRNTTGKDLSSTRSRGTLMPILRRSL